MAQSSAFLKGAVLASSVLLASGFVALRAGWVEIPAEPGSVITPQAAGWSSPWEVPTEGVLFDSSKSGRVFTPVGGTVVPPQSAGTTILPPNFTIMAGSKSVILAPTPPTTAAPPTVLMGGSKYMPLVTPPAPPQQAATPPKK